MAGRDGAGNLDLIARTKRQSLSVIVGTYRVPGAVSLGIQLQSIYFWNEWIGIWPWVSTGNQTKRSPDGYRVCPKFGGGIQDRAVSRARAIRFQTLIIYELDDFGLS
jgi:hypothetical protein